MLVCFHDYTSPASAVAVLRLQRLADEGLPVVFEGIDVLGVDATLPVTLDVLAELERAGPAAAALGLVLRRPASRPPTLAAHVVGDVAEQAGLGAAWRLTAYRAYWEQAVDLGSEPTLVRLAGQAGLSADVVATALADPRARLELRRRMGTRRSAGVGGVPLLLADGTFVPADLAEPDLRALAELS